MTGTEQLPNDKFKAQITIGKWTFYIGTYETAEDAHSAFKRVHREWWGK